MKRIFYLMGLALILLTSCGNTGGKKADASAPAEPLSVQQAPPVRHYTAVAVRTYPHDITSYTQGLFFRDGVLYESTGQYGSSTFRIVDLESGKALRRLDFDRKYFVEGSCVLDGELFILTWENKVVFVYDAQTLEYKRSYSYPREGWGLTTDGQQLIASDGSANLYFLDTKCRVRKTLPVRMGKRTVRDLNELEYIDGKIWANVYLTDILVIINPETGYVEATVDASGLFPRSKRNPEADVLNGIAVKDGKVYLTGKQWPHLYEIELKEK